MKPFLLSTLHNTLRRKGGWGLDCDTTHLQLHELLDVNKSYVRFPGIKYSCAAMERKMHEDDEKH